MSSIEKAIKYLASHHISEIRKQGILDNMSGKEKIDRISLILNKDNLMIQQKNNNIKFNEENDYVL